MRQATLPFWASSTSYHQQHPPSTVDDTALDPELLDISTPPCAPPQQQPPPTANQIQYDTELEVSTPPFPPHPQQRTLELDPELFTTSPNGGSTSPENGASISTQNSDFTSAQNGGSTSTQTGEAVDKQNEAIDVSTPEPAAEQPTAMSREGSASSGSSAQPLSQPSFSHSEPAQLPAPPPTIAKAVHPFFSNPSGPSCETEQPIRSRRSKAPISYKEDLKAVLRADKEQERARVKAEKQQARAEATAARAEKHAVKTKGKGKNRSREGSADGFELVEAKVRSRATTPTAVSPRKKEMKEEKPLRLAVKGTTAGGEGKVNPFFAKKMKPPPQQPVEGSSDQAPKQDFSKASGSSTHASWSLFSAPRSSSSKLTKPQHALWPSSEDSHVTALSDPERALMSRSKSDLLSFRARWPQPLPLKPSSYPPTPPNFVQQLLSTRPQPLSRSIPLFPSISSGVKTGGGEGQLWTDLHRPLSASACLGNEVNATYLLQWLSRLLVSAPTDLRTKGGKRKGVQRRVDKAAKKRRRRGSEDSDSDMGDFIVDDDDESADEWDDEISDEQWFGRFAKIDRQSSPPLSQDSTAAPGAAASTAFPAKVRDQKQEEEKWERLTNCILLTGPPGSGKTASVYACASELGYEVFELWPGMGKRSGKELLAAVGDLGRNHMVSSGGVGGGAFRKPTTILSSSSHPSSSSSSSRPPSKSTSTSASASISTSTFTPTSTWTSTSTSASTSTSVPVSTSSSSAASAAPSGGGAPAAAGAPAVRQSLILIEEADLLFEEDKGFWSAVVDLIGTSHRPVVLTCNDVDLVPTQDLPLQEVLTFAPPDQTQVAGYLQTILSKRKDISTPRESVKEFLGCLEGEGADLRQAIMQAHFGLATASNDEGGGDAVGALVEAKADMRAIARAAESQSVAEVFETLLEGAGVESWGEAGLDHSQSRQWGSYTPLLPTPLAHPAPAPTSTLEYRQALTSLHCPSLPSILSRSSRITRISPQTLKTESDQIRLMLKPLYVQRLKHASTLPQEFILEYAPFARLMALVDEDLEGIHRSLHQQTAPEEGRGGRSTRNSRLGAWLKGESYTPEYVRWLPLGPQEMAAVRGTSLSF